jgi:hypothetical protein
MRRRTPIGAVSVLTAATVAVAVIAGGGPAAAAPSAAVHPSVISVDRAARTATLPLLQGRTATGAPTFYVVTESSDEADAQARGVTYAPKLRNALGTKAVQSVTRSGAETTFPRRRSPARSTSRRS